MTTINFKLIAKTARELRTEAATYTLLDAYARNECATYPVDSALFMELWPDGQVPGFVLTRYTHDRHADTHTVAYAEIEPRTTHTPGSWVASENGHILVDEESDYWRPRLEYANRGMGLEGWRIASMEPGWTQEDKANARLIAAAPDLLAALQALVTHRTGAGTAAQIHQHYEAARAAIAKAGGAE